MKDEGFSFASAQEAWLWFMSNPRGGLATQITAEAILQCIDRLYKNRRLTPDHLQVLRHYGLRGKAPDLRMKREARGGSLWSQALSIIEPSLIRKHIVRKENT